MATVSKVVYIPEGYTGRLQAGDENKSLYAGGVHFCNLFIFSSGARISYSHSDPSIQLSYLENEIRWVLEHECNEVRAWRASHGDIDPPEYASVWQQLKQKLEEDGTSKKTTIIFSDVVMYETASIGLSDKEPKLQKLPNSEISFPGSAQPDLLRAVLKLNAYCTVNGDEFSPMTLIYQSEWVDLDKLTEVHESARKMVLQDPYEVYRIADRWVKECAATKEDAQTGVKDVFAYIDVYRKYKKLPSMKQTKVGVNESCPCKSGKKFKKCHYEMHQKYLQY